MFGITSKSSPLCSVEIFRPNFVVHFVQTGSVPLIKEFENRIKNDKSHSYLLVPFMAEVNVKAVLTSLNTAFLPISRSRFKQR